MSDSSSLSDFLASREATDCIPVAIVTLLIVGALCIGIGWMLKMWWDARCDAQLNRGIGRTLKRI